MTSGQYSYMLLRRMQLYVSCSNIVYRIYLYNFFGEIFNNPSVVVTEESYNAFVNQLEAEVDYCAKKNLHTMESVYKDENFGNSYTLLQNSFASIGINMVLTHDNEDGTGNPKYLIFTLPNGEQKTLDLQYSIGYDYFAYSLDVRSQLRVTDEYWQKMRPYYMLENEEILDLGVIGTNSAGYGTRWEYDPDTVTLKITGTGSLATKEIWSLLGVDFSASETPPTIIIGAGVQRLMSESLNFLDATIVDLHGKFDEIILDGGFCPGSKNAASWVVYSDNMKLRNYIYGESLSIEWHSLSEWEG